MIPHALRPHSSSGNGGAGGIVSSPIQPLSSSRQRRKQFAVPAHDLGGVGEVVEDRAADHHAVLTDVVAAEGERGDDAEVAAAAAQRPEQVRVRGLARRHQRAVGEHDICREQVVDGQPEAPGEIADAAAQCETADARRGQEARRRRHAERHGGVVDIAPGAPRVDADGVRGRIDRGAAHPRQVDHQGAVPDAEAGGVVAAAAHRDLQPVGAGELHRGHDVRGVGDTHDHRRSFVDHRVVDGTRLVVPRVGCGDHVTADGLGQVVEHGVRRSDSHEGSSRSGAHRSSTSSMTLGARRSRTVRRHANASGTVQDVVAVARVVAVRAARSASHLTTSA